MILCLLRRNTALGAVHLMSKDVSDVLNKSLSLLI